MRGTTLDDENASQHVTSVLVTALCKQPEVFASDLGDDLSCYLQNADLSVCHCYNANDGTITNMQTDLRRSEVRWVLQYLDREPDRVDC